MSNSGYEKKDVDIKGIVITGIAVTVFIVVSVIALNEYFISERESVVQEVVLKPQSVELKKLRAKEDKTLESYELLDSTENIYRIPLEKAMEIVADENTFK